MRFDLENQLCRAQAFTGAATVSAYAFNMQIAGRDMSIGRRMALVLYPTVAAGAGSTHTMEVVQADNADLDANLEVLGSKSILAAALTVGSAHELPIPQGVITRKFLGFRNTATGGTTTVTLDVYLMPQDEIPYYKSFPKAVDADVQ